MEPMGRYSLVRLSSFMPHQGQVRHVPFADVFVSVMGVYYHASLCRCMETGMS